MGVGSTRSAAKLKGALQEEARAGVVNFQACRHGRQDYAPTSTRPGQPKKKVRGEARVQHVGGLRGGDGMMFEMMSHKDKHSGQYSCCAGLVRLQVTGDAVVVQLRWIAHR